MAVLTVAERDRPDTGTFWSGGHQLLVSPASLYDASSRWLGLHHVNPLPGGLQGFISPPTVAFLFAPLALLPRNVATGLWTALDVALVLAAIVVLDRSLRTSSVERPLLWLVAGFFPPVFAEFDAGQIGGVLLLLAAFAIATLRRRPVLSGALAGLGAAFKFYPAVLALAAPAGLRLRNWLALAGTAAGLLLLSFIPLGASQIGRYFGQVLLPTLSPGNEDCALVSMPTFVARYVGGARWAVPGRSGLEWLQMPWGAPGAARVLAPVLAVALLALAVWALRRAGGAPIFGAATAFSLGALIPGTAFPYQMLALLPLLLVLTVESVRAPDWRLGFWIVFCLAFFLRAPCTTPVANLWTAGGFGLFALAVYQAPRFRVWPG